MTMKNKMMVMLLLGALPLTMVAQDDMYFVPSKKSAVKVTAGNDRSTSTYYSGSNRSVDDYNRRGAGSSYYQVQPNETMGDDIIDFSAEQGVYPDSAQVEDFALTRQMSRWDGYTPAETYWLGYNDGCSDMLSWHSPWYYSSFYPWYDSYWYWNDPWYYRHYGWYSPWYDPWYYGGYYWHHPYWYGGFHYVGGFHHGGGSLYARNGHTGTIDLRGGSRGRFSSSSTTRRSTSTFTARANTPVRSTSGNFNRTSSSNNSNSNSNFNRSSSVNSSSGSFSRSSSSGGGFSSGGGGSRSGGVSRGGRR